jgi:hypothetical protein
MTWLFVALTWMLLALAVALVGARGIRLADASSAPAAWTDEVDAFLQHHSVCTAVQPARGPRLPQS